MVKCLTLPKQVKEELNLNEDMLSSGAINSQPPPKENKEEGANDEDKNSQAADND
jgi:hypothetical protein